MKGPKENCHHIPKQEDHFQIEARHSFSTVHTSSGIISIILPSIRTFVVCTRKRLSIPIACARCLPLSPCHLVVVFVDAVLEFGSVLFDRLITHRPTATERETA